MCKIEGGNNIFYKAKSAGLLASHSNDTRHRFWYPNAAGRSFWPYPVYVPSPESMRAILESGRRVLEVYEPSKYDKNRDETNVGAS